MYRIDYILLLCWGQLNMELRPRSGIHIWISAMSRCHLVEKVKKNAQSVEQTETWAFVLQEAILHTFRIFWDMFNMEIRYYEQYMNERKSPKALKSPLLSCTLTSVSLSCIKCCYCKTARSLGLVCISMDSGQ